MSLIFITGTSTLGKSTIAKELSKRGFEAYDTEHDGISAWFIKNTGQRDAEFGEVPERTKTWMDQHEWRISLGWVKKIANEVREALYFYVEAGLMSRKYDYCVIKSFGYKLMKQPYASESMFRETIATVQNPMSLQLQLKLIKDNNQNTRHTVPS